MALSGLIREIYATEWVETLRIETVLRAVIIRTERSVFFSCVIMSRSGYPHTVQLTVYCGVDIRA